MADPLGGRVPPSGKWEIPEEEDYEVVATGAIMESPAETSAPPSWDVPVPRLNFGAIEEVAASANGDIRQHSGRTHAPWDPNPPNSAPGRQQQ